MIQPIIGFVYFSAQRLLITADNLRELLSRKDWRNWLKQKLIRNAPTVAFINYSISFSSSKLTMTRPLLGDCISLEYRKNRECCPPGCYKLRDRWSPLAGSPSIRAFVAKSVLSRFTCFWVAIHGDEWLFHDYVNASAALPTLAQGCQR